MKILYWAANYWPNLGGLERITEELVLAVAGSGHEVAVVAPCAPGRPDFDSVQGISVYRLPFLDERSYLDLEELLALKSRARRLKTEFQPDLVHVSGCNAGLLLHQLSLQPGCPTLITLHGAIPDRQPGQATVYDQALLQADAIGCCSRWTREQLLVDLPACAERSHVLPNALPLEPNARRRRPGNFLLAAGRLAPEKGFDTALEALARGPAQLRLHLAGEGPLRQPLADLAKRLGLARRVRFLGRLNAEQLQRQWETCLAVVMPSRCEGFGLVALEAAWQGVPVLASRVGGLPEVVSHGRTGLLVAADQPAALARAMTRLARDPERLATMGENAWRRARRHFRWEDYVEGYLRLYRELCP